MRFYVTLFGLETRPSQVSSRDPDSLLKGVVGPDLNRIGEGCEGRALAESVTAMVEGASGKGENMAAPAAAQGGGGGKKSEPKR
jgi:hypothetical protein